MSLMKWVRLADPSNTLPWPGVPGRLCPPEPFQVSIVDPFWQLLLKDGSVVDAEARAAPAAPVDAVSPVEPDKPAFKPKS